MGKGKRVEKWCREKTGDSVHVVASGKGARVKHAKVGVQTRKKVENGKDSRGVRQRNTKRCEATRGVEEENGSRSKG